MESEREKIKCPRCGSENWRCYNETSVECYEEANDNWYTAPVGNMVCKDCDFAYDHGGCEPGDDVGWS